MFATRRSGYTNTMRLRLLQIDRLASSPSGNPRWRLHFDDSVTLTTTPDSMLAYAISGGWIGRTFDVVVLDRDPSAVIDMQEVVGA